MLQASLKYVIIALIFGLSGFFGGYLLTRNIQGETISSSSDIASPTTSSAGKSVAANRALASPFAPTPESQKQSTRGLADIKALNLVFDQLLLAHELADKASIELLKAYMLEAIRSQDALFNYNLVSIFLEKYTSLDPLDAISFIEAHRQFDKQQFIPHIVTSWVRHDPEGAIDYFLTITNPIIKTQLGLRLLKDPIVLAAGFENEIATALGPNSDRMIRQARSEQMAPADAFRLALQETGGMRNSMLQNAIFRWVQRDPLAALAAINSIPNATQREMLLQQALSSYANNDPAAALSYVQQYHPEKTNLEVNMLIQMAYQNPVDAIPVIEAFIARTGNTSPLQPMLSRWVELDPKAALAYLATLPVSQQDSLKHTLARAYIRAQPQEGFDWLMEQASTNRQLVLTTLANAVNDKTITSAERQLEQTSDPDFRQQLLSGIARYKSRTDPQAAISWLEGYDSEPGYEVAVQRALMNWSHQDPEGAAAAISDRIEQDYAPAIASQIAANWYSSNPDDSIAWVNSLPAGTAKYVSLSNLTLSVANKDVDKAISMLRSIPEGELLDSARRNIAWGWVNREPENVEQIIRELRLDPQSEKQIREFVTQRQNQTISIGSSFRN